MPSQEAYVKAKRQTRELHQIILSYRRDRATYNAVIDMLLLEVSEETDKLARKMLNEIIHKGPGC